MLENFSKSNLLIIGDIMVDRYLFGKINGLSFESPIPQVEINNEEMKIGGTGTIIEAASIFGAKVNAIGVIGNDESGSWIRKNIKKSKVKPHLIISDKNKTITRTRVIADEHQVARFDDPPLKLNESTSRKIIKKINQLIPIVKCVVLCDYQMGIFSDEIINHIKKKSSQYSKPVIISAGQNVKKYQNPNYIHKIKWDDALRFVGGSEKQSENRVCEKLHELLGSDQIIITNGESGVIAFDKGDIYHISATRHKMRDRTSVGEILLSAFSVSYSVGNSFEESCSIGNVAAGIAVEKIGIKTVERQELKKEFSEYQKFAFEK